MARSARGTRIAGAVRPDLLVRGHRSRAVYELLQEAIGTGQLEPDAKLPSTRTLAREIGVSRNTVQAAIDRLRVAGLVVSRPGSGVYVAPFAVRRPAPPSKREGRPRTGGGLSRRGQALLAEPAQLEGTAGPFALGQAVVGAFPSERWRTALSRATRRITGIPNDPTGFAPLRRAIANHLALARGVRCTAEEVLICSSSVQALDLALTVLVDPGETVWMEDPCFWLAAAAVRKAGATPLPIVADHEGLRVEDGIERAADARAAYLTPAAQFPTGVRLSAPRREALIAWARQHDAWLIEDDYGAEFVDTASAPPALQQACPDHTCYLGTFSQVLLPNLRLAYLVAGPAVMPALTAARILQDGFPSLVPQLALHDLMSSGAFAAHMRLVTGIATTRRRALLESIERHLGAYLAVDHDRGGSWILARCQRGVSERTLLDAGARAGLQLAGLARFRAGDATDDAGIILGYLHLTETEIDNACQAWSAALR